MEKIQLQRKLYIRIRSNFRTVSTLDSFPECADASNTDFCAHPYAKLRRHLLMLTTYNVLPLQLLLNYQEQSPLLRVSDFFPVSELVACPRIHRADCQSVSALGRFSAEKRNTVKSTLYINYSPPATRADGE